MDLLLGLDQGGTKTHALVCDLQGNALALGSAPGCLHTVNGMQAALQCMGDAADMALQKIGAARRDIRYVSGGLTGIDYPYEQVLLTDELTRYFDARGVYVHNDCIGALYGGTFDVPSAVCCVGTGLNVGGANKEGEVFQFGNYSNGPYGGGGTIGQQALQHVFDAHIGKCPPTMMTRMFLDHTGCTDVDDLLLHRYRKHDVSPSKLCPLVFEAAGKGDQAAADILLRHAESWAELTLCMAEQLDVHGDTGVTIVLSGSVFKGRPAIHIERIAQIISGRLPGAVIVPARYEPVVGGAVMGLQHAGNPGWQDRMRKTAEALGLTRE